MRIDKEVRTAGDSSVETVLSDAGQMLSELSRGAGVVLAAKQDVRLKHMEFVRIEPTRALAVLVAENGGVENRIIEIPRGLPTSALIEAANYLNAHFRGRTLAEARIELERQHEERRREIDKLTERVISAGIATWSGPKEDAGTLDRPRHVEPDRRREGARGSGARAASLRRSRKQEGHRAAPRDWRSRARGCRIFIGSENKLFSLSGSSLVVAPFRDSGDKVVGVLGVIGPTRLNYARVVPAVNYTAQLISQLIRR